MLRLFCSRNGAASALFHVCWLCAATTVAYWPALTGELDFVNWDDGDYVTLNEMVLAGLRADAAASTFESFRAGNWHPLVWLSLQLDVEMYGPTAPGFHRTNVL